MIEVVVSAILVKRGRIFLQQRPPLKDFGFCWESPGGKVDGDGNESHRQALRRELLEELGIDIGELPHGLKPAWVGRFDNIATRANRTDVELYFYTVGDRFSGVPIAKEGQPGMGWFLPEEMRAICLSPANRQAQVEVAAEIRRLGNV